MDTEIHPGHAALRRLIPDQDARYAAVRELCSLGYADMLMVRAIVERIAGTEISLAEVWDVQAFIQSI